jgi:hypothetical protein
MRVAYLEWLDACKTNETRNLADLSKAGDTFRSVGILIEENDNAVIIAQDVPGRGSGFPYRDIATIPKKYITKGPIFFETEENSNTHRGAGGERL